MDRLIPKRGSGLRTVGSEGDRTESGVSGRSSRTGADYTPFDIFQWLSIEAREAFTLGSRPRHFSSGCRIYMQSEPGNEMYRIVTGSVRMSVLRRDGREVLYLVLEPGDCFGIDSLLDGAPRPHTAIASGSVELQVLRRDMYERIRCHHASVSDGMIHLISRHVRLLSEYFVSATLDELSCRVAQRLLQAHEQSTNSVGRAVGPTVRLTQGEIALMVGATRQSVNKVLKSFQDEGFISIEYGRVQVLDIARLRSATLALARPDRDEFQMEDAQEAAQSDPSQDDYPMPRVSLVSRGICVRTPPQGPGSVEADATPGLTTTRYR